MFIEIEEEIFTEIEKKSCDDIIIVALEGLFDSMYKGMHIVYASPQNLIKLSSNMKLSERIRNFIKWITREYIWIYSCEDKIKTKLIISKNKSKVEYIKDKGIIYLPIGKVFTINATKLLTEHTSDAVLFKRITTHVLNIKELNSFFSIYFEDDSYYGGNGPDKINQIQNTNRIVLCIVDSDKDYQDGKNGDTYSIVNKAVKNAKEYIPIELYTLGVREKENLFSASIYKEFKNLLLIEIIDEKFSNDMNLIRFFDIKEGIAYKYLVQKDEKWDFYYNALLEECKKRGIEFNPIINEKTPKYLLPGIGGKLCDKVAEVLLTTDDVNAVIEKHFTDMSLEKRNLLVENRNDILNRLPICLRTEWDRITEYLFSWGCALNCNRLPYMRNF